MNHVGNDIVDLKSPEAKGKAENKRFMQRVLNPDEQQAVLNSDHADSFLWAFWAAKESAYKAVSKIYPDVSSAPRRYPVILDSVKINNIATGIVNTPHSTVPVKIFFNKEYVHCIGITGDALSLKNIVYDTEKINPEKIPGADSISEKESLFARNLAKKHIASCLQIKEQDIQIIRHKNLNRINPPMIYVKGKKQEIDISLSHDGGFAAYALWSDSSHLK